MTEVLDRLAARVEKLSRGSVAFRWEGEDRTMGADGYVSAIRECLRDHLTEEQAVECVAGRIVKERAGYTSSGFKMSS